MSVEQAKAFIEKMKTDEAFREKIMAIETPEERLKAIVEAGFECTAEEVEEVEEVEIDVVQGAAGRVAGPYGFVCVRYHRVREC